jgi:hypothetical protein
MAVSLDSFGLVTVKVMSPYSRWRFVIKVSSALK